MELIKYADAELMMMDLANVLAEELEQALLSQDRVSFAVPGGTTPGPIFDALSAAAHIDWARVDVMLTDERWVPETSDRSNTRLLKERLLVGAASAARYIPLYAEAETPEDKLPELAADLSKTLPVSVMLLGMGADMHTASIFPGADKLDTALTGSDLLVPMRAPGAPEPRITLSAKVLNSAVSRHIVIKGADKLEALERAKTLPASEAPVAAILAGTTIHWAEK